MYLHTLSLLTLVQILRIKLAREKKTKDEISIDKSSNKFIQKAITFISISQKWNSKR